jgi:tetratricopeptide (TPR) repeat protein
MTRTRIIVAIVALVLAVNTAVAGPKTKGYPFQLPPAKAVVAVEKLEKVSGKKCELTDDERKLFEEVRGGKLEKWSFAEACLIASGVTDSAKRKEYVAKLDKIEADARKAIEGAKTLREKAERLLKFLHDGPMKGGYESKQTDLHTILDTGKFNCVSSAALYNVIGRRLGLDLIAVEVPQHVFSLLRDGDKKIDVETTNAKGFDPRTNGKDRYAGRRREVEELGLASVIAYNHGVEMLEENRYQEGVMASFRALSFDTNNPMAAQNALAGLTKWSVQLTEAGKFEEALTVVATGLQLAPKDSTFLNNTKAIYDTWADSFVKKSDWAGAINVYEKGLARFPGDSHLKNNLAYCKQEQEKK